MDLTPTSETESKDNVHREELLWEKREEEFIATIRKSCSAASIEENAKGKKSRNFHILFSIPCMIIPVVAATLNEITTQTSISSILMLSSSLCNIINGFFNFGKKTQQHFEFSTKYSELADEISTELCKPRKHRIDCDLFLQKITMKRNDINSRRPN